MTGTSQSHDLPQEFHRGDQATSLIQAEIEAFPLGLPAGFHWNTEPPASMTAGDAAFDAGVPAAYVASQWSCAYKVAAIKANESNNHAGVDAAVGQIERMVESCPGPSSSGTTPTTRRGTSTSSSCHGPAMSLNSSVRSTRAVDVTITSPPIRTPGNRIADEARKAFL